jgi:hypothetical protein
MTTTCPRCGSHYDPGNSPESLWMGGPFLVIVLIFNWIGSGIARVVGARRKQG